MTRKLTAAQATIQFLKQQYVERDGAQHQFFAGCFGIFGHGNVAGIGQALHQDPEFPYYVCRNEQAMVHTAAAFAKMSNRLRTLVCTTSIGPGATRLSGCRPVPMNAQPIAMGCLLWEGFSPEIASPSRRPNASRLKSSYITCCQRGWKEDLAHYLRTH